MGSLPGVLVCFYFLGQRLTGIVFHVLLRFVFFVVVAAALLSIPLGRWLHI